MKFLTTFAIMFLFVAAIISWLVIVLALFMTYKPGWALLLFAAGFSFFLTMRFLNEDEG